MPETTKRILRITLLAAMIMVADQLVGSFIDYYARKQVRDNRIELLLNEHLHQEIFVLGSSRALNNYSPEIIRERTGMSCYNLGVSGSNILFHEAILDLVLSRDSLPKLIVYNIDDYGALYKMDGIVFRKDVLYPYVENQQVNKWVCEVLDKNYVASVLMKSYRQNVNFINSLKYFVYGREAIDYKTTNFNQYGANLLVQRPEDPVPVISHEPQPGLPADTEPRHEAAFQRIQQKCAEKGVELIMVIPPLFKLPTPGFTEQIGERLLPTTHLVDFSQKLQNSKYFFNKDHLNLEGAVAFSELVSQEILEKGK
jgi:hypothetical protein